MNQSSFVYLHGRAYHYLQSAYESSIEFLFIVVEEGEEILTLASIGLFLGWLLLAFSLETDSCVLT